MLECYREFYQRLNLQALIVYIKTGCIMTDYFDDGEPDERHEAAFDKFNDNLENWQEKIKSGFFSNCSEKELKSKFLEFNNSLYESTTDIENAEFCLGFLAGFTVCNQINDSTKTMQLACFGQEKKNRKRKNIMFELERLRQSQDFASQNLDTDV